MAILLNLVNNRMNTCFKCNLHPTSNLPSCMQLRISIYIYCHMGGHLNIGISHKVIIGQGLATQCYIRKVSWVSCFEKAEYNECSFISPI